MKTAMQSRELGATEWYLLSTETIGHKQDHNEVNQV